MAVMYAVEEQAQKAMMANVPDLVAHLVDVLTGPVVAVIGNVKQTRMVGAWMRGENEPRPEAEQRLRLAAQAVAILESRFSAKTVRAWFLGANHRLSDESPVALIAAGDLSTAQKDVLAAARAALAL